MPTVPCPSCEREFETDRGMRQHHAIAHGESLSMVSLVCDNCGDEFERQRSEVSDHPRNFCEASCQGEYVKENFSGEDSWNYSGGPVEIECAYCGAVNEREQWEVERNERHYCDHTCKGKYLSELPPEETPNWQGGVVTVHCEVCGESKQVKPYRTRRSNTFFCSSACEYEWRSDYMRGENNHNYSRREVECDYCGELTPKIPSKISRSEYDFCNHECHNQWMSENQVGPNHHQWTGGRRDYGPGWNEQKREAVRERDGRECVDCGISEADYREMMGRKFDVHHLVPPTPTSNPAVHNAKRNLMTLCIHCHRKREQMIRQEANGGA